MNRRASLVAFLLAALLLVCVSFAYADGSSVEDKVITKNVYAALAKEFKGQTTSSLELTVKTFNGVVILGGTAPEAHDIKRAAEVAKSVDGVKSVDNRITIRAPY